MLKTVKQAWSELEFYQRAILVAVAILFPLGTVYPPAMEILMLPLSFVACVG